MTEEKTDPADDILEAIEENLLQHDRIGALALLRDALSSAAEAASSRGFQSGRESAALDPPATEAGVHVGADEIAVQDETGALTIRERCERALRTGLREADCVLATTRPDDERNVVGQQHPRGAFDVVVRAFCDEMILVLKPLLTKQRAGEAPDDWRREMEARVQALEIAVASALQAKPGQERPAGKRTIGEGSHGRG